MEVLSTQLRQCMTMGRLAFLQMRSLKKSASSDLRSDFFNNSRRGSLFCFSVRNSFKSSMELERFCPRSFPETDGGRTLSREFMKLKLLQKSRKLSWTW